MEGASKKLYIFIFLGCFFVGIYFFGGGILEIYYFYFSKNIPPKFLPAVLLDISLFGDCLPVWDEFKANPCNLSLIRIFLDILVGLFILRSLSPAIHSAEYLLERVLEKFWQKCSRVYGSLKHTCIA